MNTLSVVIPALNEEDGIADIVERVLAAKEPLAAVGVGDLELIVVDDGSTDRTPDIVAGYAEATLIKHPVNKGYGAAIKTGFRHSRGNLLSFLDADGTYPPEYYPQLCQPIIAGKADLVVGSRMAGAETDMPLVRRIGNTIFAKLVSIISNRKVTDSASGQRVLRRELLNQLYPLPDGLNFTPVMSTKAMHEHIEVVEVPIPYHERVGPSKLSVVHDGIRFLNTILMTALTYNPVRVLGLLGMGLVLLGVIVGLLALGLNGFSNQPDGQFAALFAGVVLIAMGIQIFATGATFNYIVSLFYKRQIRQGLFGAPIFSVPLEKRFGWLGLLAIVAGALVYMIAVWQNWTTPANDAHWFAPAVSTVMVLTGLQLLTAWLLVIVLSELSEAEVKAEADLQEPAAQVAAEEASSVVVPAAG
jgi:glycosyltransferase involved in cell wall biosynthesis